MVSDDHHSDVVRAHAGHGSFNTTQWSLIAAAGEASSSESMAALEQLCRSYWYPLYAYVRRVGHSPHDAQDLVQAFFAHFLEQKHVRLADPKRGQFRSFLITSLKRFLINEWNKANCAKRGNGRQLLSLEEDAAESRFSAQSASEQSPDTLYDRGWATVLLGRAMSALRTEFDEAGKRDLFETLKGFVWGENNTLSYSAMAQQLGMSEGAVRVATHRLRNRFGELLRDEVARTVTTPLEVEEELRYLISVVRNSPSLPENA